MLTTAGVTRFAMSTNTCSVRLSSCRASSSVPARAGGAPTMHAPRTATHTIASLIGSPSLDASQGFDERGEREPRFLLEGEVGAAASLGLAAVPEDRFL